jgi:hypothetical protein
MRADHFNTIDIFAVTYQWSLRLSTVTTYTFQRVKYADSSIGMSQDRVNNTFDETLQFSLTSRTNLVADYGYEIINYDTAPNNSTTHYLLGGVDHHLTEHLVVHARGGPSFRSLEGKGDFVTPSFEGSLRYVSSNHSLTGRQAMGSKRPMRQTCRSARHSEPAWS